MGGSTVLSAEIDRDNSPDRRDVSLDDFFWIGGRQEVLHPYLKTDCWPW